MHKSGILGKPVYKHDLKKEEKAKLFEVKPRGGGILVLLLSSDISSLSVSLLCLLQAARGIRVPWGTGALQGTVQWAEGFFPGSGPGWMKAGKAPPPAMRNGQTKE